MDLSLFAHTASKSATATQTPVQNSVQESTASDSVSEQAEEFDTFLELLTAQIRNQDPLAPLDSTQFVEQLATFSNLELQAKNNQILEGIAEMLARELGESSSTPTPDTADTAATS